MDNSKERLSSLDFIRGIMMLLVVFGHSLILLTKEDVINTRIIEVIIGFIYSFHMPVLFALSGYVSAINKKTIKKTILKKEIIKNIISLYIPYLIMTYLYFIERLIASKIMHFSLNNEMNASVSGGIRLLFDPGEFMTWFLFALLIVKIISSVMVHFRLKWGCLFIFLVLFLISILGYGNFLIDRYLSWGIFYIIGFLIKDYEIDKSRYKAGFLIISFLMMTTGFYLIYLDGWKSEVNHGIKLLVGVGMFYFLLFCLKNIKPIPVINFWGRYSLILFFVHGLIQYITYMMLHRIIGEAVILIIIMNIVQIIAAYIFYLLIYKVQFMRWLEFMVYPHKFFNKKEAIYPN